MKYTTSLISFFAVLSQVNAKDVGLSLLSDLINAPWCNNSSLISNKYEWDTIGYGEMYWDDQGYASRCFVTRKDEYEMKLYTYFIPSLEDTTELIFFGLLKHCVDTEDKVIILQKNLIQFLEKEDFQVSSVKKDYHGWGSSYWKNVLEIRRANLYGLTYYRLDRHSKRYCVKIVLNHEEGDKYKVPNYEDYEGKTYEMYSSKMSGNLVSALETANISAIIGEDNWHKVKESSEISKGCSAISEKRCISINGLMAVFERLDTENFKEDLPLCLLFKDYIAEYIFLKINYTRKLTLEQKEWFQKNKISFVYSPLGDCYHYTHNLLFDLKINFPDSHWGQLAFLKLMFVGFDPSHICAEGSEQWSKVLTEGKTFLDKYSNSPFVVDVLFLMGEAEETVFTLGLTRNDEVYVDWTKYIDKNEESRVNALKYYHQVLKMPSGKKYENRLKYILPRLKTGVSTGNKRYYCIYD